MSLLELANRLHLSLAVVEEIYDHLRKVQLCEVKGMNGTVRRIAPFRSGKARALELLPISHYAGAAPVSLEDYNRRSARRACATPRSARYGSNAPSVAWFLRRYHLPTRHGCCFGPCHHPLRPLRAGKTAIAECLPRIYGDEVWIPYAVEVDNQIITVYDSHVHEAADGSEEITANLIPWTPITAGFSANARASSWEASSRRKCWTCGDSAQ